MPYCNHSTAELNTLFEINQDNILLLTDEIIGDGYNTRRDTPEYIQKMDEYHHLIEQNNLIIDELNRRPKVGNNQPYRRGFGIGLLAAGSIILILASYPLWVTGIGQEDIRTAWSLVFLGSSLAVTGAVIRLLS